MINRKNKREMIKELIMTLAKDKTQYVKWLNQRGITYFNISDLLLRDNVREFNYTIDLYELGIDLWGTGKKGLIFVEGLKKE